MTIITAPLVRGRNATVVPRVETIVTPGSSIDVLELKEELPLIQLARI